MNNQLADLIRQALGASEKVQNTVVNTTKDFLDDQQAREEVISVVAESISEDLLDFLMMDGWFRIEKDASVSYGEPHTGARNIINWAISNQAGNPLKDYGFYGKFFESALFGVPSNSFSGPDIPNRKIELKTSVIDKLERVWNGIKRKNFMTAGGTTNEITGEKSKAHLEYDKLIQSGTSDEAAIRKAYAEIGVEKLLYKMENYLFASVSTRGPSGGNKRKWGKTGEFAFTKLLYFYSIIEENVRKILQDSIKVTFGADGVAKAASEFIAKKSSSYVIKIGFEYIEPWKTAKEWAENPNKLYRTRIDLFNSIKEAQEFFNMIKNLK